MSYYEGESCLKTLALHEECLSYHLLCHANSKKNFKKVITKVLFLALRLPLYGGNSFGRAILPLYGGNSFGNSWQTFGRSSFVQDTKREQNVVKDIQVMRIIENLRDQDKLASRKK